MKVRSAAQRVFASLGSEQRYILLNGLGAIASRVAGTLLIMLIIVIVTRALGAADYGKFAYFLSVAFIVVLLGGFGLPISANRLIVRYRHRGFRQREAHFLLFSLTVIVVGSSVAMLIAVYGLRHLTHLDELLPFPMWAMVAYVSGTALATFLAATCRAIDRPMSGALGDHIHIRVIILLGIALFAVAGYALTLNNVLLLWTAGTYGTVLILFLIVSREILSKPWPRIGRPLKSYRVWLSMSATMMVTPVYFYVLSETDILMLGFFRTSTEVGVYNVARRLAEVMQFAYGSVVSILMPRIAAAYGARDKARMQSIVDTMNAMSLIPGVSLVLILVLFGKPLLSLFGDQFIMGYPTMLMLCLPRLVDMMLGPATEILIMSGHQTIVSRLNILFGLLNIALNVMLVPPFGIIGAAAATAITIITWNIVLYSCCLRRTDVQTCLAIRLYSWVMKRNAAEPAKDQIS